MAIPEANFLLHQENFGTAPLTPTQTQYLAQRGLQAEPIAAFHLTKFANVVLYWLWIELHVVLESTKWNFLQLLAKPFWIGDGVLTPLAGLIGVGFCPITPTQIVVSAQRPVHLAPTAGFHWYISAIVIL